MSIYYGLSRSPRALCPDGTARVLPGAGRVRPQYCRAARPQALAFDRALPASAHKISTSRLWQSCVTRCQQRATGIGMDGGSTSDSSYSDGGRSQQTAGEERHGSATAGWESGWDAQLATHREWLLAGAGSGQHGGTGTGQSSAAVGHAAGYTASQPPAPGPGMTPGGISDSDVQLREAVTALADAVSDAAASRSDAWTDEQVAALLQSAAHLAHRRLLDAFKKRQQRSKHAGAQGNSDDHAGGTAVRSDGLIDVNVDGDARQAAPQKSAQMQPETAGGGSGRGGSGAVSTLELNCMAAGDLARMLWALARLEVRVPSVWLDGIVRVLLDAPACTREPLLPSLPSPHSLPDLTARAWQRAESAGALGAAVSTGSAAAASTALGLQALPASELMRVAWAVVQLSASATRGGVGSADAAGGGADQAAGGVTRKWAQALFSATQTRMREFSPDQLVGLLWAVGRGRREPNGAWRRSAAQALSIAAPQLAPWQLARVTVALAALRVALPYDLVVALLAALHDRLDAASAADVAGFVWGLRFVSVPYSRTLARMQMRPLLDLAAATQPQLQGLPAAQLVQLADGFAHLGLLPGAEWMRLHREACIRQKSQFSEANRRKVRQAYAIMWTL
eukprot:XP_001701578.1 predicted protein [Chlamydomonas reinhardtii]